MRRTFNENTAIPLAKAVVRRGYNPSFGRGQSQLARLEEFYYDPEQQHFVLRGKGELIFGSWRSKFFPCSRAQACTILSHLPLVTRHDPDHRFIHRGKLCKIVIDKRFRLQISLWFYVNHKATEIALLRHIAVSLLDTSRQKGWLEKITRSLSR